jgi:nucleotide-binding universal stress UspA family protein
VSLILERADCEDTDLIVMGTHGRSGISRAILGSVTERVVRESQAPVLTIPPAAQLQHATELPPFDPILCASDFSPACRRALDLAVLMGEEADARLVLLHALQYFPDTAFAVTPMPVSVFSQIDFTALRKNALARLESELPADVADRCRPEPLVVGGRPADVILEVARQEDVKLIVMGTQSRGTVDRLLFGSTTRRVIQAAPCPVLSVRASQAEARSTWFAPATSVAAASMGADNR